MKQYSIKFPGKFIHSLIFLISLLILSLWGQISEVHLIYGTAFFFGSIFLLVTLRVYGLIWGVAVAILVNVTAYAYYDQPMIILLTSLEVLLVGIILYKKDRNMIVWDALYWVLIGAPITALFYYISFHSFSTEVYFYMLKVITNGLFNVLIADMIIAYVSLRLMTGQEKSPRPILFKQILFHFSIAAVVSPFFIYMIINSWNSNEAIIKNAKDLASAKAFSIEQELEMWAEEDIKKLQLQGIIQIAYLQDVFHNTSGDLHKIIITNKHDVVLASNYIQANPKDVYNPLSNKKSSLLLDNLYQIDVHNQTNYMDLTLSNDGYYMYDHPISNLPFQIYVNVPIAYYQSSVMKNYINHFQILLLFAVIAAILSSLVNRVLTRSLTDLAASTTGLPGKLKHQQSIEWPQSNIHEIRSLITNYKHMSENLVDMFSKLQHSEERLLHLAYYDVLTALPNRLHFIEDLQTVLKAASEKNEEVAVLFIDLNQFKQINDTLGHAAGDQLLQNVAAKLKTLSSEQQKVFRLGGDEFIIVRHPATDPDIEHLCFNVIQLFVNPILLQKHTFYVTASIGISVFPRDGSTPDTILKNADMAMYAAKENGGNYVEYYSHDMNEAIYERTLLNNGLREAVINDQFLLHYQPKVDGRSGDIVGMEALLRWNHPEMGQISPMKFIPLAEETGQIIQIDEWVLKTACTQNKQWQDQGHPKIPVAVNLSAKHFYDNYLYSKITNILQETGLEPQYLRLEITEGIFIKNIEPVIVVIKQLEEIGVYISIDDFGTGYSSLNQLQMLPIYDLKIDKSFIRNIDSDAKKGSIVKTIIDLAHNMNLKVIAEGVESREELHFLLKHQCDLIQGFLFSKPLRGDEFLQLFTTNFASLIYPQEPETFPEEDEK